MRRKILWKLPCKLPLLGVLVFTQAKLIHVCARKLKKKLLDSRIATTSNPYSMRQVVSRPIEKVWRHNKLGQPFATELQNVLKDRFGNLACLEGAFRFSWTASSELGRWCSDRCWTHALADDDLPRLAWKVGKFSSSELPGHSLDHVHDDIMRIKEASSLVRSYYLNDSIVPRDLSDKALLLHEEQCKYFERPTDTKCIVFFEKKGTIILNGLSTHLDMPYLTFRCLR